MGYYYSSSRSMAIRAASTIRLSPTHQMTEDKGKLIYIYVTMQAKKVAGDDRGTSTAIPLSSLEVIHWM